MESVYDATTASLSGQGNLRMEGGKDGLQASRSAQLGSRLIHGEGNARTLCLDGVGDSLGAARFCFAHVYYACSRMYEISACSMLHSSSLSGAYARISFPDLPATRGTSHLPGRAKIQA